MKVCSMCKISKDLSEFYKMNSSKDGHRPDCKSCHEGKRESSKE